MVLLTKLQHNDSKHTCTHRGGYARFCVYSERASVVPAREPSSLADFTFHRLDGAQPDLVNIQFQKNVQLQLVILYLDFKLEERYTPSKIFIWTGVDFHNIKVISLFWR
ncbi:hypothetical protein ZWY2020_054556 [Hordeum vulgare]|nr:hypothetical protein ZWY2020_054556 [Hordeum vulgare]